MLYDFLEIILIIIEYKIIILLLEIVVMILYLVIIRMIFEGLCDIEDWCNDVENLVLIIGINYSLKYFKIENYCFKL